MRRTLTIAALLLGAGLYANTLDAPKYLRTLNKHKVQIDELRKVFPESKSVQSQYENMERALRDAEAALRSGIKAEAVQHLRTAGEAQRATQLQLNQYMLNQARNGVFRLSEAVQNNDGHKDGEGMVLFRKARQEWKRGEKFYRDRNLGYSMHILKTSITYTITAFEYYRYPLPSALDSARKAWYKPKPKKKAPEPKAGLGLIRTQS